jgi:phosphatidylinositol kinase/protein kinase (PI-3  family)
MLFFFAFYPTAPSHFCFVPFSMQEVPFRLTRNVMTFLSPLLVDGVLASGMASAGLALSDQASNLKPFLELLLHDDVVAWQQTSSSATGASAASDASGEEDPMKGRSSHNAQVVLDRLEAVAPRAHYSPTSITPMPTTAVGASSNPTGGRVQRDQRVDHQVHRLIEAAAQPERLCQMNPTWMPWL